MRLRLMAVRRITLSAVAFDLVENAADKSTGSGSVLADTTMPEAFEHGGKLVGLVTTLGFAVAFTIHPLD
jgi:hypothetical protein